MKRTTLCALLLFGSGLCALVYQSTWLREFRLIFGASTAASAAVLAIFMGGICAGSLALGKRADKHDRPLLFYAHLELLIALTAALTPLLLFAIRPCTCRQAERLASVWPEALWSAFCWLVW